MRTREIIKVITHICVLGLLTISLGACHKDKKEPYVLTGRLVTDCSGTPYANKELKLYQQISGGGIFPVKGGTLAYATTDANGYFRFEYKSENGQPLWIESLVKSIPVGDLDIGEINVKPSMDIRIQLHVVNEENYTEEDTLFYQNFYYPGNPIPLNQFRYKVGPFIDGAIIDSVDGVLGTGPVVYGNNSPSNKKINYYLNAYDPNNLKTATYNYQYCNENPALIIFSLD